jgi:uncharacterized 2Fe-2S/4Fe-4S cluster protein (DUF4445 family)
VPDEALVVFAPSGRRGRFPCGTSVLEAARALGVDLDSVCGGRALCGRCQVEPASGQFPKHGIVSSPQHLSTAGADEHAYAGRRGLGTDRRLGCTARIHGDVVLDVPPQSQRHRQLVRKRAEVHRIRLDPVVRLHYVELAEPDMHEPTADLRRLEEALAREWGLEALELDNDLLATLQPTLRQGRWQVTVAVHAGRRIIAVWPGLHQRALGVAVDVGSTTVAAQLCDLGTGEVLAADGVMNPQIRFGEDLMSRVSYAVMHPEGVGELTRVVREAVAGLILGLCKEVGADPGSVLDITLVGNPVMHHLFLGIDPRELGGAPFALAVDAAVQARARALDLPVNPGARVYLLPCIAGHVGADAAAVVLSEAPHQAEALCLVVDVGTNAEIVLGNRGRLLACSSPTGPAFEGAQVTCGQRAAPGAIERVRIDRDTLEPRFKVIGCELWSDEPDFAAQTAATGVTGICGSGIIEALAEMFLAGILAPHGIIDERAAARSSRVHAQGRTFAYLLHDGTPQIVVTQTDVRSIQLAKAALYAGARLLMERLGVERVERVRLAGAFGNHIDPLHAMVLGLVPDCALDQVSSAGNAAGTGARIALLDRGSRTEIETLVRRIEKVETAVEPRFQEHFVAAMALPHASDPFPHLAAAVELPAPAPPARAEGRRGPARRRRGRRPG